MNRGTSIAFVAVAALAIGLFIGIRLGIQPMETQSGNGQSEQENEVLYWVAPMDPAFRRDKPGKSPMAWTCCRCTQAHQARMRPSR